MSRSNWTDASDEELMEAIERASGGSPTHNAASTELQRRHNARLLKQVSTPHPPHWTVTPLFIVAALTLPFAAIAASPVIREWLPVQSAPITPSTAATASPSASPSPSASDAPQ